jgi:hypothetical protein
MAVRTSFVRSSPPALRWLTVLAAVLLALAPIPRLSGPASAAPLANEGILTPGPHAQLHAAADQCVSTSGEDDNWSAAFTAANSPNGPVNAIAISGTVVYVGGSFSAVAGVSANNVARWNGSAWSAVGGPATNGVDGTVYAIAVAADGGIYVGGAFNQAGAASANNIARWNGSAWSALGAGANNGVNDTVNAIAVHGSDVYFGGYFSAAGGDAGISYIARWNGSAWSAVGGGVNSYVFAAAADASGRVYVGGDFDMAGGAAANRIGRWSEGSGWEALGDGFNGRVKTIAVRGTAVYAGGEFSETAGGSPVSVNRIAVWDGAGWSALGQGVDNHVRAIAVSADGRLVYAGGSFIQATDAGGASKTVNQIAQWDNDASAWATLGSGVGGLSGSRVNALAVGSLFVGGYFTQAGGKGSYYCAQWSQPGGLTTVTDLRISRSGNDAVLVWSPAAGPVHHYEIHREAAPYFSPATPLTTTVVAGYNDANVIPQATSHYYAVRAADAGGQTSGISNRVGKFTFTLTPGQ